MLTLQYLFARALGRGGVEMSKQVRGRKDRQGKNGVDSGNEKGDQGGGGGGGGGVNATHLPIHQVVV